jgi:hypothetical protein
MFLQNADTHPQARRASHCRENVKSDIHFESFLHSQTVLNRLPFFFIVFTSGCFRGQRKWTKLTKNYLEGVTKMPLHQYVALETLRVRVGRKKPIIFRDLYDVQQ